jgi:glyoxylase-like metal-dependent hydrolase (beta-lactamase superfamily II)
MKLITFEAGIIAANCHILISEKGNAVIIDAPGEAEDIISRIESEGAVISKILLTHGHFDHIDALNGLDGEVFIHENDLPKLYDPLLNLSEGLGSGHFTYGGGAAALKDGAIIKADELVIKVWHTPGHTNGSVCFIIDDMIFSGDALFKESLGRKDFPTGDSEIMKKTLKMISGFNGGYEDYRVFPGHGEETSLMYEKRHNPYLTTLE